MLRRTHLGIHEEMMHPVQSFCTHRKHRDHAPETIILLPASYKTPWYYAPSTVILHPTN